MKKAVLYLLFTLLLVGCGNQSNKQADEVNILFEIRPEVNYVTHLYTLAGLRFSDEEYTAKYGHTLPKTAVDTLQKYKEYLTFGQGEGGMLSGTFFFMVSAETFANADSLQKVMDKYQEMAKSYNSPDEIMNVANAIAKVYVDNYDRYIKNVYPQAKKDMEERQDQYIGQMKMYFPQLKRWRKALNVTDNEAVKVNPALAGVKELIAQMADSLPKAASPIPTTAY